MKKIKTILGLLLILTLVFSVAACSSEAAQPSSASSAQSSASATTDSSASVAPTDNTASASTSASAPAASNGKKYKIAVVTKDATMSWFVRMNNGVTKFAQDTGNDAVEKGPTELDAAQQAQVMEDMIAQGVDAICVVPIDPSSLESVCKKAKAAGIVVIAQEASTLQNCDYDVEAFNNKQYGAFMMDNLAQAMGQSGTYTTMVAALTNASQNEWADGAVERAKSAYTNMKLLDAEPRVESDGNSDTAYQKTKELIKKYPDLKGIVGSSSYDAPGVARAIEELGLKGKFFTSGTGMPQENAQILKDGDVTALTLWDPADAGYAMCSLAVKVLNGEKIQDGLNLGIKGYDSLKFASGSTKVLEGTGWITITKDNVDSFGF